MLLRDMQAIVDLSPRRQQERLENTELLIDEAHYRRCNRPIALCDKCLPVYLERIEEAREYSDM